MRRGNRNMYLLETSLFHLFTLRLFHLEIFMRCDWAKNEPAIHYHDTEWGVPQHDDRSLFEFLILEGAQAGLSWDTVLAKRENYRAAFDNFDPAKIAAYDERKCAALLENPGIIRNRLKVASAVRNAKCFLEVAQECGSFDAYIWGFVDGKPIKNVWENKECLLDAAA